MIIDGKQIAKELRDSLAKDLQSLQLGYSPVLCDVVVGDDLVSLSYVAVKQKAAKSMGVEFLQKQLPEKSTTLEVIKVIQDLILIPQIKGIIVQLPLPKHINRRAVLDEIPQALDVDCLGSANSEDFFSGKGRFTPPTAAAIDHILTKIAFKESLNLSEKKFVVVGQGDLVGKPVTYLLEQRGYEVVAADDATKDLSDLTLQADVLISATGRAGLIKGEMIKPYAVVIDAGTSESGAGIMGDVDYKTASLKASYITPVPGGVGPVTVAKLLENVVLSTSASGSFNKVRSAKKGELSRKD